MWCHKCNFLPPTCNASLSGTFGNILTLLVMGKTKHLFNHCTPLLLNLAVGMHQYLFSDVVPVARLEDFRDLKSYGQIGGILGLKILRV